MSEFEVIGKRILNVRSGPKAIGQAIYTDDIKFPNMLYGKILRSPFPHARIINIDISKAKAHPGVRGVVTGQDVPRIKVGALPTQSDRPIMAIDKVRHVGEPIAALVAVDEETAEEAIELIKVDYEALPAVFDPEEAIKPGAPRIHDECQNNISFKFVKSYGDTQKGFHESDYVREDTYYSQPVNHAAIEPHGVVSQWNNDGTLTVWIDIQMPFLIQRAFARVFNLPEDRVRVIKTETGGGFGGKGEFLAHYFASTYFSRLTGKPVKLIYSREEVFIASSQRHPVNITLKTGVKKDGTLVSQHVRYLADGGAYMSTGPLALTIACYMGMLPYILPNYSYEGIRAYTNKTNSGPMQGHAVPQLRWAVESQLDMIAAELRIDPMEIRRKNAVYPGYKHPVHTFASCGFKESIDEVEKYLSWKERKGKLPSGHGLGIACSSFVSGVKMLTHIGGSIVIQVNADAGVTILSGAADIGQGTDTVLSQIVAEELGVTMDNIRIISADTAITPMDQGTFSSGVTLRVGNAAIIAAKDVKKQLLDMIAPHLETAPENLECRGGKIFVQGHPEKGISFAQAVRIYRYAEKSMPIIGKGNYIPDITDVVTMIREGGRHSPAYSFMCQGAEVKVDKETGDVKVLKLITGHDCGRVINPINVEGQLDGAVSKGIGQAFFEDQPHIEGNYLNNNFLDFLMPTSLDHPDEGPLKSIETDEPNGPFGAKESGEGNLIGVPPAIANAIFDAIGVRITDLPITPDKIKKALEAKGKG